MLIGKRVSPSRNGESGTIDTISIILTIDIIGYVVKYGTEFVPDSPFRDSARGSGTKPISRFVLLQNIAVQSDCRTANYNIPVKSRGLIRVL